MSLKEIKGRILSVQTTQKTTSAMRMVASAKLHRTQNMTQTFLAYVGEMQKIIDSLQPRRSVQTAGDRSARCNKIALVAISSSSGLCGAFNSNIAKETFRKIELYKSQGKEVVVIPVGKKIAHELHKAGIDILLDYYLLTDYLGNPKADAYAHTAFLVEHLVRMFNEGHIDGVEILYHHFRNMGSQVITSEWLDIATDKDDSDDPQVDEGPDAVSEAAPQTAVATSHTSFLTEPSPSALLAELHPKMLNAKMYGILLDSVTSEHAARMMAMQTADDNAKELLQELTLLYNKSRQQAITNELIDIMGGKAGSN